MVAVLPTGTGTAFREGALIAYFLMPRVYKVPFPPLGGVIIKLLGKKIKWAKREAEGEGKMKEREGNGRRRQKEEGNEKRRE